MARRTDPPFSFGSTPKARRRLPDWVKKAVIVMVIVAAIGAYLYHDPSLIEPYLRGTPLELPARMTTIYRYRDSDGNLQHSNTPPPAGVEYEVIQISSETNVMPMAPPKE